MLFSISGIISMICGGLYPLAQVFKILRNKAHALSLDKWFILLFLIDKLASFIYAYSKSAYLLEVKYIIAFICGIAFAYYKFIFKHASIDNSKDFM